MKNETHVQFHESVITAIETVIPELLGIASFFPLYRSAFDKELETLLVIRKSELTAQISEQDRVRDDIVKGFSAMTKGYRSHYAAEYRVAANRLWNVFLHYGDIAKRTLDNQTAAVNDILREFERPDLVEALETLSLTSWKDKLAEENNKFHQLMMARYNESVGKTTLRMKDTRVETDKYYRAIIADLENKLLLSNTTPEFDNFITELNAIIKRFKDILAQEFGRRNALKNETVPPPATRTVTVEKIEDGKFQVSRD